MCLVGSTSGAEGLIAADGAWAVVLGSLRAAFDAEFPIAEICNHIVRALLVLHSAMVRFRNENQAQMKYERIQDLNSNETCQF